MNKCIDCGKILTGHGIPKRCASCAKKGILHPFWKGGLKARECFCKDCGKKLGYNAYYTKAKRCNSCSMIRKIKLGTVNTKGINNPAYKHGKYIFNNCIDCKKEISPASKRCCHCEGEQISKRMKGKNNPMWSGGWKTFYYSKEFKKIRKDIREKYKDTCQLCFKFGKITHHIDYNKDNNIEINFIILCDKCHSKVNFNRDYWYAYFTYLKENNG